MSRYYVDGVTRDQEGHIITSATVSAILTGTSTVANLYTSASTATVSTSVTSDAYGYFYFYLDNFDYDYEQGFDITISKNGYTSKTYSNRALSSFSPVLTTYTISAAKTPSTHIVLHKGMMLTKSGSGSIVFSGVVEIGNYQVFSGFDAGDVTFNGGTGKAWAAWFGFDSAATGAVNKAAILAAVSSISSTWVVGNPGGEVFLHRGNFTVAADISILTNNVNISGASDVVGYSGNVAAATRLNLEAGTSGLILGAPGVGNQGQYLTVKNLMINGGDLITNGIWFSGLCNLENVTVINCVNGILLAENCNQANLKYVTVAYNSAYGILSNGTSNTVINISHSNIRENDDVGLGILYGAGLSVNNTVIEANFGLGLYIYLPEAGSVGLINFTKTWFENNDRDAVGTRYSARISSYLLSGGSPFGIYFSDCNFDYDVDILAGTDMRFENCYGPGEIIVGANPKNITASRNQNGMTMVNGGDESNGMDDPLGYPYLYLSTPGAELVTNGTVWTGATGATPPTGWTTTGATHTIFDSGDGAPYDVCLKLEHDGVNDNPSVLYGFQVLPHNVYEISVAYKKVTSSTVYLLAGSTASGDQYGAVLGTSFTWDTMTIIVHPTRPYLYLTLVVQTSTGGQYSLIDTVSIKKITRNWTGDIYGPSSIRVKNIPIYADNAAAIAGGLKPGNFYRVNAATDPEPLYIVH